MSETNSRPILQRGDTPPELRPLVVIVQGVVGVNPDGEFGPKTEAAVKAFQRREQIAETGIVDAPTWARLDAALLRSGSGIGNAISLAARMDIGQRETVANRGFVDKQFERDMKALGWRPGFAWCDFEAERIWKAAYAGHPEIVALLDRMFTGGTLASFRNFQKSGRFVISQQPKLGALCYEQHGLTTGHVMVVTAYHVGADTFRQVSGNTSKGGSREGFIVAEKDSPVVFPTSRVRPLRRRLGFVWPIDV